MRFDDFYMALKQGEELRSGEVPENRKKPSRIKNSLSKYIRSEFGMIAAAAAFFLIFSMGFSKTENYKKIKDCNPSGLQAQSIADHCETANNDIGYKKHSFFLGTAANASTLEKKVNERNGYDNELKNGFLDRIALKTEYYDIRSYEELYLFINRYINKKSHRYSPLIGTKRMKEIKNVWEQYKKNYDFVVNSYLTNMEIRSIVDNDSSISRMYPMPSNMIRWESKKNFLSLNNINAASKKAKEIEVCKGPTTTPKSLENNMKSWNYKDEEQLNENKTLAIWMWFKGIMNDIDPNFIFSVATHESEYGSSRICNSNSNLFGIHKKGGEELLKTVKDGKDAFRSFKTRRECIIYFVDLIKNYYIKNGQNNIYLIASGINGENNYVGTKKKDWIIGVVKRMYSGAKKESMYSKDTLGKLKRDERLKERIYGVKNTIANYIMNQKPDKRYSYMGKRIW